ncbi:response regulator transcription factor [Enterococcus casseliflavus]|uniref:response regulator transcription factor n=1 Tax=Enterococcus casseliflavus TaxID=37734 RepID=UPI001883C08D|nr:response regulator transcription factor [Enterococcus casseliflavus]MBE9908964.1 response regulator transcription factor [Enterococcus casseliflavus]
MKILLVDDHLLIGKSLEITLKNFSEITAFKYLSNPDDIFSTIDSFNPSLILMDIHLKSINGLELGKYVLQRYSVKLVFLSGFDLVEYRDTAMKLGAHGFLNKDIAIEELVDNIKKVLYDNRIIFPNTNSTYSLTNREKEILQYLSQGVKQTAIASELEISERTVRNHIYSINEKLETGSVVSAIMKAVELGIIHVNL